MDLFLNDRSLLAELEASDDRENILKKVGPHFFRRLACVYCGKSTCALKNLPACQTNRKTLNNETVRLVRGTLTDASVKLDSLLGTGTAEEQTLVRLAAAKLDEVRDILFRLQK